jgi:hypothetical protein
MQNTLACKYLCLCQGYFNVSLGMQDGSLDSMDARLAFKECQPLRTFRIITMLGMH